MAIAIIAEYNPFHNGHIYQLQKAKELFPNEKIVIILSKKFVQRGELAICSYKKRKKIALKWGANKIIPLSTFYSSQAAHFFAKGAIEIIHKKNIDKIFFGSESNDPKMMLNLARKIEITHKNEYEKLLKINLKKGWSFPKSSSEAIQKLFGKAYNLPNDILAFEYCKNIVKNNFTIKPFSIKRTIGFHSTKVKKNFASATKIRMMIKNNEDISNFTPMKIKKPNKQLEDYYPKFQKIIKKSSLEKIKKIKLVSEGIENLFKKHIKEKTLDDFLEKTTSKRYTSSRIKRIIIHIIFKIK